MSSPSRFVQSVSSKGSLRTRRGSVDGGEGGGEHDALHARIARGAQGPERAVAGGDDQLVLVLRYAGRNRRGDMEHVVAPGGGFGPTVIRHEIRSEEGEAGTGLGAARLEHLADFRLAGKVAHRGADLVALFQQLQDAVRADEAGAAGDEDCGHGGSPVSAPAPKFAARISTRPQGRVGGQAFHFRRHCEEPTGIAFGDPEDRLRDEAIQGGRH